MAAVGAYSMPARHTYTTPASACYMMQTPQAAAAALTAAMVQVVHNQPQAQQPMGSTSLPQAMNQTYRQVNSLQTTYGAPQQVVPQQATHGQPPFTMQMSAPQWAPLPQFTPAPSAPPPPLTEGMPDPAAVDRQKAGYLKTLEEQRQHFIGVLDGQRKDYMNSMYEEADKLKQQFLMQLDQQIKEQSMALEKQYSEQVLTLNQQFHQQRGSLEQEAIKLKGDYQQKQLEEKAMQRQFQLQKERCEMEQKYAADMQQLQQQQHQVNQQVAQSAAMSGGPPVGQFQTSSSYAAPPPDCVNQGGMGSYVPPATLPAQQGSYVPPVTMFEAQQGSYVPPVTMFEAQQGSYVPPVTMPMNGAPAQPGSSFGSYVPPVTFHEAQQGSYVPPPSMVTVGSYAPPTVVSYVPPEPALAAAAAPTTELAGSYVTPVCVTQPQYPVYSDQGWNQVPPTRNSNVPTSAQTSPAKTHN